jgi:hypothetical protein
MASTLKINTLTGVTTAGSIAVTGEGNSTTTNLQQGLAKAFAMADMDGDDAIEDSFNFASVVDNGSGDFELNFTNNMSSASYAKSGNCGNKTKGTASVSVCRPAISTSSAYKFTTVFASSTSEGAFDADDINSSIHGDLA